MYGFRAEAALYDDTFQPYGQIFSMKADGSDKKLLTDSQWEDSMPLYLPRDVLSQRALSSSPKARRRICVDR